MDPAVVAQLRSIIAVCSGVTGLASGLAAAGAWFALTRYRLIAIEKAISNGNGLVQRMGKVEDEVIAVRTTCQERGKVLDRLVNELD